MSRLRILLELSKIRIAVLATLTCVTGYVLAADRFGSELGLVVAGVFLLACGSAALNQIQERELDARMDRTKARPIPSGRVRAGEAALWAAALIAFGALSLAATERWIALGLGLFALVWYNGVYTPLKRVTAFAVVPGAVIGAIPPVLGWSAAGGDPVAPQILALAFFLFVWQIPHFWLILLYLGKDYEKAGLPSIHSVFSPEQLTRLTFIWILATALSCLAMPLFGLGQGLLIYVFLTVSSGWMVWHAVKLVRQPGTFRLAFRNINIYALLVLAGLSVDRFVPL